MKLIPSISESRSLLSHLWNTDVASAHGLLHDVLGSTPTPGDASDCHAQQRHGSFAKVYLGLVCKL